MITGVERPIRVWLLEEFTIVRAGVKLLIEADPGIKVVAEAANRQQALGAVSREQSDIILLDVFFERGLSVDFLRDLCVLSKGARAIILTGSTDGRLISHAVQAGAVGLVSRHDTPATLIRAIHQVHAGEAWLPRTLIADALSQLMIRNAPSPGPGPDRAKILKLTPREREIVGLVATGVNRKKIAAALFVSEATVRNHLTAILAKLDLTNRFDLVFYAHRNGLSDAMGAHNNSMSRPN